MLCANQACAGRSWQQIVEQQYGVPARRWSDADLKKLAGLDLIRTLCEAETVCARLQEIRKPSTVAIEQLDD
jgi:hypothetical protein